MMINMPYSDVDEGNEIFLRILLCENLSYKKCKYKYVSYNISDVISEL